MITAVEAKTKAEEYMAKLRESVTTSDELKMAARIVSDDAARGSERVVIDLVTLDPSSYCAKDFWRLMVQILQERGYSADCAGGCLTIDWSDADSEEEPKAPAAPKGWGHD